MIENLSIDQIVNLYVTPIKKEFKLKGIIIEDNDDWAYMLSEILHFYKIDSHIVMDTDDRLFDPSQLPDCDFILMDIMMPLMDTSQAVKKIRKIERYAETPIILVSATKDTGLIKEIVYSGATHFIPKPFTSEALIKHIYYSLVLEDKPLAS